MNKKKAALAESIRWDLSDLYKGFDDPQYQLDKKKIQKKADSFAEKYQNKISGMSASGFQKALKAYSDILDLTYRIYSFAYLSWTVDTENPERGKSLQEVSELVSEASQKLIFFDLEWISLEDEKAQKWMDSPDLSFYKHYLETIREKKQFVLEEKEEKILSAKSVSGTKAWVRFFKETIGSMRFEWQNKTITEAEILSKQHDPDRSVRKEAAEIFTRGLDEKRHPITYVFNTLLLDKKTNDRLRKYPHWLKSRNMSNEISDESVESLVQSVVSRYPLVHRFYALKKRLMGLDEMMEYDRYAPVLSGGETISWEEARQIVIEAFSRFHPEMGRIASLFFEKNWIDAAVVPGKQGGAYSASVAPSVHPYVFMNYLGKPRDVQTLAHELGHGVHQYLSRKQGVLQADTPLTMAETASVFGEMLVFQKLLEKATSPEEKMALLVGRIDDTIATVFRQISMNRFEDGIHRARREEGELTWGRFSDIWMETQQPLYGTSVTLTENYRSWWSYIPHFIHTPGYVYAYAFGNLLVLALYQEYLKSAGGFEDRYIEMLEKGGSKWPWELVSPFGMDINQSDFWEQGLEVVETFVQEAENLLPEVKTI